MSYEESLKMRSRFVGLLFAGLWTLLVGTVLLLHGGIRAFQNVSRDSSPSTSMASTATKAKNNKTLVILIGNLRCGEPAWQTLYQNILDVNSADLALMVGDSTISKRLVVSTGEIHLAISGI
jgi:hypothetical protein